MFCVLRYKQQIFRSILFLCHAFSSFYNIHCFLLVGVGFEISQYCERFSTAIQSQHTQMYWYLKGISVFFSYSIEGNWFFFPLLSHVFPFVIFLVETILYHLTMFFFSFPQQTFALYNDCHLIHLISIPIISLVNQFIKVCL